MVLSTLGIATIFICIRFIVSFECPKGCDCSTTQMYDCSDGDLTNMVNETDDDIRTLDLSNNSINQTNVLDAPYLIYLSLANNKLTTLKYDTFDNLDELKTLIISNNSIKRITDDVFEWNPLKLELLHLDGNQIEFIQHFLFYDLEELTELHLQNNLITFIHPHAFLQLKKLRVLRLDNNHLHTFDSKWFKGLKANMFESIWLQGNPWSCDCSMFPHVKWLDNSKWFRNVLSHHDLQCKMPPTKVGQKIRNLQNDSLPCDKPDITGISENTKLYVNQSIELDCVVKKSLPFPQLMWIAPNGDRYTLQTADRYEGIEFFQNGSMIIHKMQLNDTGKYTCVASINGASVEATTNITVQQTSSSVKSSNVAKTEHKNVDDEVYVEHSASCPSNCTCVAQHVDCSSDDALSGWTSIPFDKISSSTKTLSFASNMLKDVPSFPKVDNELVELRLDNNIIENIQFRAFDALVHLQTLTLRDNKISTFKTRPFRKLEKLTILVLDNNQLEKIDSDLFYGLKKLQWLYIRNNLIENIDTGAFTYIPVVRFIHLESNHLPRLELKTLEALTEKKPQYIQKVFVDDNDFDCDCHLEALRLYLVEQTRLDLLFGDGIMCTYPGNLNGQFLHEIKTELKCNFTYKQDSKTYGGNDGNKPCHFPFEYNKQIYNKCIKSEGPPFNGTIWCSTTTSFSQDGKWGICATSDYSLVPAPASPNNSGISTALWFLGLFIGFAVCGLSVVLYKKYGHKFGMKSMKYSNIPGYDEAEENRTLTSNGGANGSEAFV